LKIAILLGAGGRAAGLQDGGSIYVFERKKAEWQADIKLDFSPAGLGSMTELRAYIGSVSRSLGDCRILAAKLSTGFFRIAFESFGVALWAVEGVPRDYIGLIEAFYSGQGALPVETAETKFPQFPAECEVPALIVPVPNRAGYYTADLRDVMAHRSGINSREALLPFFRHTPFSRLELICDHIPRWFETELPALKLRYEAEYSGRTIKVYVYPQ
jgi:Fe-only nitrogenase accessory protein AnfO